MSQPENFSLSNYQWAVFLNRLLLLTGLLFLTASVTFFIAANWHALGRFSKLLGLEALLCAQVISFVWLQHKRQQLAKALLASAALVLGVLLAFIGQTYQTGADPWQLFALWALLMLPWAGIVNHWGLWLWWVLLINIAIVLYQQSISLGGFWLVNLENTAWLLIAWQGLCLVLGECGVRYCKQAWCTGLRILGVLFCALLALQLIMAIIESAFWQVLASLLLATVFAYVYRYQRLDSKMLASVALFYLLASTSILGRGIFEYFFIGGFFTLTAFVMVSSIYMLRYFKTLPEVATND